MKIISFLRFCCFFFNFRLTISSLHINLPWNNNFVFHLFTRIGGWVWPPFKRKKKHLIMKYSWVLTMSSKNFFWWTPWSNTETCFALLVLIQRLINSFSFFVISSLIFCFKFCWSSWTNTTHFAVQKHPKTVLNVRPLGAPQ